MAAPALLIAGARDEKFVAINRRMAEAMPSATLCVIPDAGHIVHVEQPEAFLSAAVSWLCEE
jgi:2-succinyl-6-hydroxy-2,4-cyclohexadiene-1-carboxylate synthase